MPRIEDDFNELDYQLRETLPNDPGQSAEILREFSRTLHRPVQTLYVLDAYNDPFNITILRAARAEWFAHIWHQLNIPIGYHYRRIHYRMISQAVALAFYAGGNYENTEECWTALNVAARDAVALGLIPSNAFVDRRNPNPIILLAQPMDAQVGELQFNEAFLPQVRFHAPLPPRYGELNRGIVPQRYHIEISAEKSTMNDILKPLAERYQVNLITGVGELTYTACRDFVARLNEDRPARIIYISDFDPSGQSMPVAVARKIEFELYRQGLDPNSYDVQVRPIILTHAQCVLPGRAAVPHRDVDLILREALGQVAQIAGWNVNCVLQGFPSGDMPRSFRALSRAPSHPNSDPLSRGFGR